MIYKKLIIIVLVFSMVLGLIPLSSVECITPVSAAHLVCRNCGYKETLNESSGMCAAAGIPIWLIKKIKEIIIWRKRRRWPCGPIKCAEKFGLRCFFCIFAEYGYR